MRRRRLSKISVSSLSRLRLSPTGVPLVLGQRIVEGGALGQVKDQISKRVITAYRLTASTKLGSLFLTLPTSALTGQHAIRSAR